MDAVGINPQIIDVSSLTAWGDIEPDIVKFIPANTVCNHALPPFMVDESINEKISIWKDDLTRLRVGAVVHSTNEFFNELSTFSERLFCKAGPELKDEIHQNIKYCKTGDVQITSGFNLPARYIIHTVGPLFSVKYQIAAETGLFNCYRKTLECAVENNVRSVGFCCIHSSKKGFPKELGVHIALRTVRRFLEKWGTYFDHIVFALGCANFALYNKVMPLYFPRNRNEEQCTCYFLPKDLGNEKGEPFVADRQIRITDNPHHGASTDILDTEYHPSLSVGEHSFARMEDDVDKQRLLGSRPSSLSPEIAVLTSDLQHRQRYERLLRRAKTENLAEISGIGCLYQCGVDKLGRPVIVFIGKWFNFNRINLEKALLYIVYLLDPLVCSDYIIIYFHTITSTENHPSFSWIRQVYEAVDYKYKKNLKAFYIVHPTFWTKVVTWWFTTFMAPQIKNKVHTVAGIEYLYNIIDPDQLEIPAYITEYDMTINGIRYYKPSA